MKRMVMEELRMTMVPKQLTPVMKVFFLKVTILQETVERAIELVENGMEQNHFVDVSQQDVSHISNTCMYNNIIIIHTCI